MRKPLISVIIPVYGVEAYLDKCVESVLEQTYTNLEILLVDDGSPDRCPEACDEWAKKDERIKVIHKKNGGLSDARNAGLDAATGEYIGFVDSDDYILPNMYERLYGAISDNNADLGICNYVEVDEEGNFLSDAKADEATNEVLNAKQAMEKLFNASNGRYIVACTKLYSKKVLSGLRFEKGRLHEDEFIVHHVFDRCDKIACIKDAVYMYLQRKESIMGNAFNIRRLDFGLAHIDRYDFFKEKHPEFSARQAVRVYASAVTALQKARFKQLPEDYRAMVNRALKILIREKDPRFFKLLLLKFKRL